MRFSVLISLIWLGFSVSGARAADLVVFAAASLQTPLDALAATTGGVTLAYGGSGTLARQVMQGAPADIVVLAHPDWMAALAGSGAVAPQAVRDVAGNSLTLVGPAGAPPVPLTTAGLAAALGQGRLATGFVTAVPAGIYARQALTALGLWDTVAPRLAETDNVRAALALVARGAAPLGITYATDAAILADVAVLATFPPDSHDPIRYQAAITAASSHPAAAAFLDLLTGAEGQAAFAAAGFLPPPPPLPPG